LVKDSELFQNQLQALAATCS